MQMTADEARADLLRLINGFQASQALHVAASLGLADLLGSGHKCTADLAKATETHPVALYRLMRALASIGVFHEGDDSRFELTRVGQFLRSDVAGTHAPMAQLVGRSNCWEAWGDLLYAVRTGTTAFDHVHGSGVWDFRARRPEEARIFDRAMASGTEHFAEAVIAAYDFSRFQDIVDIGGGDGMFLAKILASQPRSRGTLFDQPNVVDRGAALLRSHGLGDRSQAVGGSFFVNVPNGGDAYLLKWILHDWQDTAATDILRCCRRVMKPSSRLLVVEHVIGAPNVSPSGKFMDLTMMVVTGGRERTCDEFAALFAEAGFRLLSIIPTATELSILEGAPEMARRSIA